MKNKVNTRFSALALSAIFSLVVLAGCGPAGQIVEQLSAPLSSALLSSAPTVRADTSEPTAIETPAGTPSAPISPANAAAIDGTLEDIYAKVSPSVVYIEVLQKQTVQFSQGFPFSQNQSPDDTPGEQYRRGSGSGFVWDDEGHIVTNNHVVADADKIRVTFSDGMTVEGALVGSDADSDLAVVQVAVPANQLRPVMLADSTQVKVGELAIAIGNPFGLESTMTVGIISALGRSLPVESGTPGGGSYSIPDVIQTDAPINPGNSGGILLDAVGKVTGVTSAIISPVGASAGIGFAIPAAIVQKVVPALIETGEFIHPWLGISGTSLTPELNEAIGLERNQQGALVGTVAPDGPAAEAGLLGSNEELTIDGQQLRAGGDVIVRMDEEVITTFDDLVAYLTRSTEPGQSIALTILRDGTEQRLTVTLRARPGNDETARS